MKDKVPVADRATEHIRSYFPLYRNPNDVPGPETDQLSLLTATACPSSEEKVRQEFKEESDTAYLMEKFKAGVVFPIQPVEYGERDYTMNLQDAIHAVNASAEAWNRLPAEVRGKYRTWIDLQNAIAAGEYPPVRDPAVVPPGPEKGVPSESAAARPASAG